MTTITQLNNETILVKPEFHIISGRKKLRVEDLNLPKGVSLPPTAVASLGSKKFIDPKEITKFNRLRDQAFNACEKVGIKFLGGFAVPFDKADDLSLELDGIMTDFESVRQDFLANYDALIEGWCAQNPDWAQILRRAITPKARVAESISSDYTLFQVSVPDGVSSDRMNAKTSTLGSQLFIEVAKEAKKFVDESLRIKTGTNSSRYRTDNEGVTQKALRPIRRMRDKMEGLAFLSSSVRPVIDYIDSILSNMPDKGRIQNKAFNDLLMLSMGMSDENKLVQLGSALGASQERSDNWMGATTDNVLEPESEPRNAALTGEVEEVDDEDLDAAAELFSRLAGEEDSTDSPEISEALLAQEEEIIIDALFNGEDTDAAENSLLEKRKKFHPTSMPPTQEPASLVGGNDFF